MSTLKNLEIFERAVEADGRLLRAEADRLGPSVGLLALTFDVGRIVVRAGDTGLEVETVKDRAVLPGDLEVLDEEDPWWRFSGQPITAAWPGGVEEGVGASGLGSLMVLKLRFRKEGDNPRIVRLEATGPRVRVTLEEI